MNTLQILCHFYWILTGAKALQLLLCLLLHSRPSSKKNKERIALVPNIQVIVRCVEILLLQDQQELSKIPRKELQQITDEWLQSYSSAVSRENPRQKRFSSLHEAKHNFFRELCQETSSIYVNVVNCAVPFVNGRLDLVELFGLAAFCVSTIVLFMRECFLLLAAGKECGQAPNRVICKLAAAITITDVYIVCCHENIDFGTAIHKYPFISKLFQGNQPHPLIGRATCPIYKRSVVFRRDAMDFDYDFVATPQATLRQKHASTLMNIWERCTCGHIMVLILAVYLVSANGSPRIGESLALPAAVFYATRTIVDWIIPVVSDNRAKLT